MLPSALAICSGQLHGNLHVKETVDGIFWMPLLLFHLFALCHHECKKKNGVYVFIRVGPGLMSYLRRPAKKRQENALNGFTRLFSKSSLSYFIFKIRYYVAGYATCLW